MEVLPKIRVSFYMTGDEFDIEDITRKMNIIPTKTRQKEDFPVKEFAHTEWVLDTEKESCKVVSWQFEKILERLHDKQEIINQICKEKDIKVGFVVTVFMENGDGPEFVLTKEIISFLASINAEIGFDLYID
ncbi:DUF4279 domain-containing protein [Tissierella praeacuta]|uniref:DUF4279 domain-containing protein n=1 Tax=Tissierella praeacuta TaxID=43131 RepID=UPI002FD8A2A2